MTLRLSLSLPLHMRSLAPNNLALGSAELFSVVTLLLLPSRPLLSRNSNLDASFHPTTSSPSPSPSFPLPFPSSPPPFHPTTTMNVFADEVSLTPCLCFESRRPWLNQKREADCSLVFVRWDQAGEERGENARLSSFVGAMALGDLVKSTLGPKVSSPLFLYVWGRREGRNEKEEL